MGITNIIGGVFHVSELLDKWDKKKLESKEHKLQATLKEGTVWGNGFTHAQQNKTYMVNTPVAITEKQRRELESQHHGCFIIEKNPNPFTAY